MSITIKRTQEREVGSAITGAFWDQWRSLNDRLVYARNGRGKAGDADEINRLWGEISRSIAMTYLELKAEEARCASEGVAMGFGQK